MPAGLGGLRRRTIYGRTRAAVAAKLVTIRIQRTLMRTRTGLQIGEPKTASARRTIPLGRATMEALRGHRRTEAEERLRLRLGKASDPDLVFASEAGTLIDPSNLLANSYYPLLRRAGLPRLTFHTLRHSSATLMLRLGRTSGSPPRGSATRTLASRSGSTATSARPCSTRPPTPWTVS